MRVLSLFDGIAGARIALEQLGVTPEVYYAAEIDPHAIKIALKRWPDIELLGNVKFIEPETVGQIDLLIGGSSCASLSQANRDYRSGLEHGESQIFWEYVRLLDALNPQWWLFENVASMTDADKNRICEILGVRPWLIDSARVSAQQRDRYYWTNLPITQRPKDQKIRLQSILENGYTERKKALCLTASYGAGLNAKDYLFYSSRQVVWLEKPTFTPLKNGTRIEVGSDVYTLSKGRPSNKQMYAELGDIKKYMRKLSPLECERLQNVPEGYTIGISDTQRYKTLGNGFTIGIIKHFLKGIT